MGRDDEAALARDVAMLRALVDRLLDDGVHPADPVLIASSLVLRDKLADLAGKASDPREPKRWIALSTAWIELLHVLAGLSRLADDPVGILLRNYILDLGREVKR